MSERISYRDFKKAARILHKSQWPDGTFMFPVNPGLLYGITQQQYERIRKVVGPVYIKRGSEWVAVLDIGKLQPTKRCGLVVALINLWRMIWTK